MFVYWRRLSIGIAAYNRVMKRCLQDDRMKRCIHKIASRPIDRRGNSQDIKRRDIPQRSSMLGAKAKKKFIENEIDGVVWGLGSSVASALWVGKGSDGCWKGKG